MAGRFFYVLFYSEIFASFDAGCADFDAAAGGQGCPLEVHLATALAGGVELGGTGAVGIPAAHQ